MKDILKNYRRRLLNLGSGNRALVLLRLSREMHLDVASLDFVNSEPAFSTVAKLLSGQKKITLSPYADSRHAPVAALSRRLRYIRRKADMLFEERGSRELYLGWPFVHGKFLDGTAVRCPLLFFPVALQVNTAQAWELVPDTSRTPQFNQSFLLAYAHYMGTPLAEALTELDLSTLPQHPLEFRTQVYELLKAHQLSIHAGSSFFEDKLTSFQEYKKAGYGQALKPGQLYLQPEAILGIFPQAASFMLSDYDALLARDDLQDMEDLFYTSGASINAGAQAQHTFTAFEMDAAQEVALQAVKHGKSMVVQGPPGTGKSQLICNLVSDFTARGKKVLVVSQKRAALDVVYQRLRQKGLGTFAGLVHDINTDRKAIYAQLLHQIEEVDEYKKQNLAHNSIYTDRLFLETGRGINRCIQKLEAFKKALFDASRCGWSAKELYLRSSLQEPHLPLSSGFRYFTAEVVAEFLPRLRQYLQQAIVFEQDDFVWRERRSMKGFNWPQRQQLEQTIRELPAQYHKLQQSISHCSGHTFRPEDLAKYTSAVPALTELQRLLALPDVAALIPALQQVQPDVPGLHVQRLRELYLAILGPDAAMPAHEVASIKQAANAFELQRNDFIGSIKWFFSPEKKMLQQALAKYNWELNEENVLNLRQRLEVRQQAAELMQHINAAAKYNLQLSDARDKVLQKLDAVEQALTAQQLLQQLYRSKVLHPKLPLAGLPAYVTELSQAVQDIQRKYKEWLRWLPDTQIKQLITKEQHGGQLLQALPQHFEPLVAYDTLFTSFLEAEREIMLLLVAHRTASAAEAEKLFCNSLYLAWLHELETKHPELRMPSNGELEATETELQALLLQKQQLSEQMVLSQLREQTYKNIETNRLGNAVTYRRLQAQVSKKRSLYPIRKLFSLFSEEILALVPCWLASPETVSAVLPLAPCFDLVIFDEASQCFAEAGIPALMRGRQAVIAGDQQQLQPADLYRARWSTADAAEADEELTAESLLQLCSLYLPQTMLTQHYRSRYPELIDFSNRHFYGHKLELIPELEDANARRPAIQFMKVHGLWQNNANQPEAARVVHLLLKLLEEGKEDIGVITFNHTQQMLIQDLLEETARAQGITVPPSVLVKNIENIQGDEKEVIILSVGYAPDGQGQMAVQFGSLNRAGGENRLNVAITRAKQHIFVVSSIRAEQLQVAHTLHPGPKLLKEYLLYAQQVSRRYFRYKPLQPSFEHPQGPLLKERLQQQVRSLQPEVPFADLTRLAGQQYAGVVLTDDDLYFSHVSVRHAHADVPQLLQQRHWPYQRVYSRQFWEDAEGLCQRLQQLPQQQV